MAINAYHVIFVTYGSWLPNDPRGSWSNFIGSWNLFRLGKPFPVKPPDTSTHELPPDLQFKQKAGKLLRYPPVCFSGKQALAVAHGFAMAKKEGEYSIFACAILPEHVHLVIGRHPDRTIGRIVSHLKARATRQLSLEALWEKNSVWANGYWKVFLDVDKDIRQAIQYTEENPVKEGKPYQHWSFVTPYWG